MECYNLYMDNKNKIIRMALINALCAALYVAAIGDLMYVGPRSFVRHDPGPIAPIAILLLFVLSVAVMGLLFFGRPIYWYLEGQKKESVHLAVATVSIFSLITFFVLGVLFFFSQ